MLHKVFHALADIWRGFIFSTCLLLQESSFPFYFFPTHFFSHEVGCWRIVIYFSACRDFTLYKSVFSIVVAMRRWGGLT